MTMFNNLGARRNYIILPTTATLFPMRPAIVRKESNQLPKYWWQVEM
jgi:hypothetical protein